MGVDPYTIKWFYGQSRGKNHAVLFIDAVGSLAMKEGYPLQIYDFPYVGKYYMQCQGSRSIGQEDHEAIHKVLDKRLKTEPTFFYQWGARMEKVGDDIRLWADNKKNTDWRSLTNEDITSVITEHCSLQAKIWAVPLAYAYYSYFNDKVVEAFIQKARDRLGEVFDIQLPTILAQEKTSEIGEEKIGLLTLALEADRTGSINENELERHWRKFCHLNNYYYWGQGYSLEDMRNRLQEEMKKSKEDREKELTDLKPKVLDYSLFTDDEVIIIKSMKKLAHAFQYADETLAYATHNIRGVYNEAAKRLWITYNQLVSMLLSELMESLKKGKIVMPQKELDARYQDHTLIVTAQESIVLTGDESRQYAKTVFKEDAIEIKEFKGVVAFKGGLLKGKVHIISHADEIASFKQGEILVTPMTNPSFVPAMQKALAIITNDGGLLCHAAIVSRELRVPCVIGTKIATKILKDGDMVEVDADKGIVRILKNA